MGNIYSLKVDEATYSIIKEFYADSEKLDLSGEYIDFACLYEGITVTGYLSKRKNKTITFSGEEAIKEVRRWDPTFEEKEDIKIDAKGYFDIKEQIGSDEVGVGDFFLPMIVVAAYFHPKKMSLLKELGVTDSKKLSDAKIREIAPILIKEFPHSKLTLSNEKYNEMYEKGENINSLKAKMHHRALKNVQSNFIDVYRIYVDQFVSSKKFYEYLSKDDEPILRDIVFKTKGETYFPSVAIASVIARYALLLEKDKLEESYGAIFPFGASKKVDQFAKELKEKIPEEDFKKLVKANFVNYKNLNN